MSGTINWPIDFSLSNLENQEEIHKFWIEISNDVLVTCFIAENLEYFTKQLYDDDVVQNRMKMVAFNSVSYDRISAKSISRISDWQNYIQRIYKLRSPCPTFKTTPPIKNDDHKSQNENKKLCMQHHHQAYKIESIINVHCWDQAKWRGTSYHYYLDSFPYMSFIFSDEKSGRRIFVDWQKQFGKIDKNDAISLSIIRQPPKRNQHHYCVIISPKFLGNGNIQTNKIMTATGRYLIMLPNNSNNLSDFLELYKHNTAFYISPAFYDNSGIPKPVLGLAILKHHLTVKSFINLNKNDPEYWLIKKIRVKVSTKQTIVQTHRKMGDAILPKQNPSTCRPLLQRNNG